MSSKYDHQALVYLFMSQSSLYYSASYDLKQILICICILRQLSVMKSSLIYKRQNFI